MSEKGHREMDLSALKARESATRLGLAACVVLSLVGVGRPAFSQEPPADLVFKRRKK